MSNSFNFTDWLSQETLRLLLNKLEVAQFFNTDYNKDFKQTFAVGDTVRVNFPQRFTPNTDNSLAYTPQAINRRNTTVTIDQVSKVHFEWDDIEAALKLERPDARVRKEYLEPAAATIAQDIDKRAALFAKNHANNIVGVLGTDPTTFQAMTGAARQRLIELACPPSMDKGMIISPSINTSLVAAAISLFNPSGDISKQYKEGSIGRQGGFDWYESMSLAYHTAGTWQAGVTISTTATSGSNTLVLAATTGDTFKQGDVISVANVYATNPMTYDVTTYAQTKQFVIQSDVTAANSLATVTVLPVIYGPGSQYQNVNRLPTASDVVTLFPGTSSPNGVRGKNSLAIHRDAFALVAVPLEKPSAVEVASQTRDPDTGVTVRFVRAWDPQLSKMVNRFDCIYGFGSLYQDNCCVRVLGA